MAAVALTLTGASIAQAAPAPMISPQPGTPDASTTTQISIFGAAPGKIESVYVAGSASGPHSGRLERYSRNQGASYVMSKAFTPGETVTAVIRIKGRKTVRDRVGIEHPGTTLPILVIPPTSPPSSSTSTPTRRCFRRRSRPSRPSKVNGDIFLTPLPSPEVHPNSNNELTINPVVPVAPRSSIRTATSSGSPGRAADVAADLRIQEYGGHKVLTWWQGGVSCRRSGSARA